MNRDLALQEVYKRHIANVMQFFPIKTAKGIMDLEDDDQEKAE